MHVCLQYQNTLEIVSFTLLFLALLLLEKAFHGASNERDWNTWDLPQPPKDFPVSEHQLSLNANLRKEGCFLSPSLHKLFSMIVFHVKENGVLSK